MEYRDLIVLKGDPGICFKCIEGNDGEIIIRAYNHFEGLDNYKNPPIPKGYHHYTGEWDKGFIIKRDSDGSQFIWIPVGSLDYDGTLDGKHFFEQFGRRNFGKKDHFDFRPREGKYYLDQSLIVGKYGGFYISRYLISKNEKGKPQSIRGALPWTNVDLDEAMKIAESFQHNKSVKSHLTSDIEYDTAITFAIKAKVEELFTKNKYELTQDGFYYQAYKRQCKYVKDIKEEAVVSRSYEDVSKKDKSLGFRVVLWVE